jgi:hypothetical protein
VVAAKTTAIPVPSTEKAAADAQFPLDISRVFRYNEGEVV